MKITVNQIKELKPCYSIEQLTKLIPFKEIEVTIDGLLSLPRADSRWFVSRLLDKSKRVIWARACADRAADAAAYAAASAADAADAAASAADAAAYAAAYAAASAADAADAAASAAYAASAAEHKKAMEHAIELLG